jgi:hypothetical protein
MPILRTDVISLFDVDFRADRLSSSQVERLISAGAETDYGALLEASFEWLFYGEALPGFRRLTFQPPAGDVVKGVSLLFGQDYGVGVLSVWCRYGPGKHPLQRKQEGWDENFKYFDSIKHLLPPMEEIDRHFPFIALRIATHDIEAFATEHAEELGRLLTGGYDYETRALLQEHVRRNISRRQYERLFLTWTDALGVYDETVDDHTYELTFMRALQVFEACIVVRRILKSLEHDIDQLLPRLTILRPHPWQVNRLQQRFKDAERELIVSPPIGSVEAELLLGEAFQRFGIDRLRSSASNAFDVLERRFQWAKTQFLVGLGVLTYLLDKLKIFDLVTPWWHGQR